MLDTYNLKRFLDAQETDFETALAEIKAGKKRSHWMWYIFPQMKGLGLSTTAQFYAISGTEEAHAYLENPVLEKRLLQICRELLQLTENNATVVFGSPDDLKLKSSMTLFAHVSKDPVFGQVLQKFYGGQNDSRTLQLLQG